MRSSTFRGLQVWQQVDISRVFNILPVLLKRVNVQQWNDTKTYYSSVCHIQDVF